MAAPPPTDASRDDAPPIEPSTVDLAVQWAREAGALTLDWFRRPDLPVDHKGDGTPVTVADRDAESLLRDRIAATFPLDGIIGEEHGAVDGSGGRTWVLDPIDGTKAFSCGVGTYSNLVYLEDEHGPALGVINLPALGETVWAGRGLGCFLNGEPTGVDRGITSASGQVLCVSGMHFWTAEMFDRVQHAGVELRTWGDAYGYALVATGRAAAMFDPVMAWWDLAAVRVVIEEAGGTITRRDGDPRVGESTMAEPYPYSAIASAGPLHPQWVELLADRP